MGDDDRIKLDGEGFSKEPFTDEEIAKHRHMRHHYERNFLDAEKFIEQMGIGWIVSFSKSAPMLVKIVVGGTILGGALAWAAEKGLF